MSDQALLAKLEQRLGKKLPRIEHDEVFGIDNGYAADTAGRIVGLNLCSNQLTALPSEIGGLAALQTLDLARNQLTALPPEIGGLASLQTLVLSYNKLVAR